MRDMRPSPGVVLSPGGVWSSVATVLLRALAGRFVAGFRDRRADAIFGLGLLFHRVAQLAHDRVAGGAQLAHHFCCGADHLGHSLGAEHDECDGENQQYFKWVQAWDGDWPLRIYSVTNGPERDAASAVRSSL